MPATTDLCDAHENKLADGTLRVLAANFHCFGIRSVFSGPVKTLKVFEDNSLVRSAVESAGNGRVLVVDGAGSMRCALLGGNLGQLAEKNGWAGVVLNAPIRDADEIDACAIGVRALGTCPVKSKKTGAGSFDLPLAFGSVVIKPGDWCYADRDGVLFSDTELA
ncbi:MAG: ribonuclease E activity regulator RraA [Casimicrobium sp.]